MSLVKSNIPFTPSLLPFSFLIKCLSQDPLPLLFFTFMSYSLLFFIYSHNSLLFLFFALFGFFILFFSRTIQNKYRHHLHFFRKTLTLTKLSWLLKVVKNHSINVFHVLTYLSQHSPSKTINELNLIYQYYNLEYSQTETANANVTLFSSFQETDDYHDLLLQLSQSLEDQSSFTLTLTSLLPLSFLFVSLFNVQVIWLWPFLVLLTFFLLQILNSTSTGLVMKLHFAPYTSQIEFLKKIKTYSLSETSPHKILFLSKTHQASLNLLDTNDLPSLLASSPLQDPVLKAIVFHLLLLPNHVQRIDALTVLITTLSEINSTIKKIRRDQTLTISRFILMQSILAFGLGITSYLIPFFAFILQNSTLPIFLYHVFFGIFLLSQSLFSENPLRENITLRLLSILLNLGIYVIASFLSSIILTL